MLGGSQLEDTLLIVHLVSHAFGVFSCKLGCFVVCLLLLADYCADSERLGVFAITLSSVASSASKPELEVYEFERVGPGWLATERALSSGRGLGGWQRRERSAWSGGGAWVAGNGEIDLPGLGGWH